MSLYARSTIELFHWLNAEDARYVVLRDTHRLGVQERAVPDDVDLLIEDEAIPDLREKFAPARRGVKIDVYGVRGQHGSDYHRFSHLPEALAAGILDRRQLVDDDYYEPAPADQLNGLLYHLLYHKNLQSGIDWSDPQRSARSPHAAELSRLMNESGIELELTQQALHAHLQSQGLAVTEERLIAYIQNDFHHGRKSFFHAWLQNQHPGELNLFVIRGIAIKHHRTDDLLRMLEERFRILKTKSIPWKVRFVMRKRMRGGKWRRGGRPHVAVVVFDPRPTPTTEEDRSVHPFVFNRNQFAKLEWRDWFVANTTARDKDNPIHSTDNEAEAFGHLPLFFDETEQQEIYHALLRLRNSCSLSPENGGEGWGEG